MLGRHQIIKLSESGQTALAILMLMVIALVIGITVSDRFIRGLRAISMSDNSSKAVAIAEAAIERLLVLPSSTLEDYITFNSCGSSCYLEITDANGQKIIANVTLSHLGNSSEPYLVSIKENETNEVFLNGYTSGQNLYVCWSGPYSIEAMYIYRDSGDVLSEPFAYNSQTTSHPENNFAAAYSAYGYPNCFTIAASETPETLRLKAVYGHIDAYILPASGFTLPIQGILIDSVGKTGDISKTVTVIKSNAFVPSLFDYSLYQKSTTDTLSN